ncbi:hypothetical protein V2G26_008439 [Clonostachys chloroleuca]
MPSSYPLVSAAIGTSTAFIVPTHKVDLGPIFEKPRPTRTTSAYVGPGQGDTAYPVNSRARLSVPFTGFAVWGDDRSRRLPDLHPPPSTNPTFPADQFRHVSIIPRGLA